MSCRIFLYDVSVIHQLWAVQELDILCVTVLYISTWCHWYWSTVSCPGTWYFDTQLCCIFPRDIIGIHLLWAFGGTWDFMCISVVCQRDDFITHSGCCEKYILYCYIDVVYIYIKTLFNIAVLYYVEWQCIFSSWIFTQNVQFRRKWCWVSLMTTWCQPVIFECEHV